MSTNNKTTPKKPVFKISVGQKDKNGETLVRREKYQGGHLDIWMSKSGNRFLVAIPKSDLAGTNLGRFSGANAKVSATAFMEKLLEEDIKKTLAEGEKAAADKAAAEKVTA